MEMIMVDFLLEKKKAHSEWARYLTLSLFLDQRHSNPWGKIVTPKAEPKPVGAGAEHQSANLHEDAA
jgi:hypothetical protein